METLEKQLIKAVLRNDIVTTATLLNQNVDPNFTEDKDKVTPLHFAALNGSVAIAKALIAAGANVQVVNADGQTPLDIAKLHNHNELVEFLTAIEIAA